MHDQRLITLSALQHYAFCPRQCALIHSEDVWVENYLTTHGKQLHERVDYGLPETRKGIRYERAVEVSAPKLGLVGKLDLIEIDINTKRYYPIEYKRGKPKINNIDLIQLCAQALCLEEMLNITINHGAMWYWEIRKRCEITIDNKLRDQTINVVNNVKELLESKQTPIAVYSKSCEACSLIDVCNPHVSSKDKSSLYYKKLFLVE